MTPQEYVDPRLFPLTTQPGLRVDQQMLLDAVNYDDVRDALKVRALTPEELRIAEELRVKHAHRAEVKKQLDAAGPVPPA